jgi:hypothetical protein
VTLGKSACATKPNQHLAAQVGQAVSPAEWYFDKLLDPFWRCHITVRSPPRLRGGYAAHHNYLAGSFPNITHRIRLAGLCPLLLPG